MQLDTVLESLQGNPSNVELQTLQSELQDAINVTQSAIDELRPLAAPAKEPTPEPVVEKWSKANHPAFQPGYKRPGAATEVVEETQAPVALKVNDQVMAKWVTGDKAFYAARILSITGSKADPIYTVKFKAYDQQETVRSHDIRAMASDSRKRKAESTPSTPTITTASNSNTISAAASINPDLVRKEPSKVSDGPARPAKVAKKIKANRELEAGKSKWQDFAAKGKYGKMVKKDSMFKTGEGVTARVGFVGSGTTMRQDPARKRHVYDQRAEEED